MLSPVPPGLAMCFKSTALKRMLAVPGCQAEIKADINCVVSPHCWDRTVPLEK